MPFYNFACDDCGHEENNILMHFDEYDRWVKNGRKKPCPECDANMRKVITAPNISRTEEQKTDDMMKKRFEKRNLKISRMPKKNQERFKKLIDSTGGKRAWEGSRDPSDYPKKLVFKPGKTGLKKSKKNGKAK